MSSNAQESGSALPLPQGSAIGILGGGQLGRMSAIAASLLGYRVVVLSSDPDDPAVAVSHKHICAEVEDRKALAELAELADIVTYEREQLPLASVTWLSERVAVAPNCLALEVAQDRIREKSFFGSTGIPTVPWRPVTSVSEIVAAADDVGRPAIFKVAYGGYDGKGQATIEVGETDEALYALWERFSNGAEMTAIVERKVAFDCELSVIVARDRQGKMLTYDPSLNDHKNHILDTSTVPAAVGKKQLDDARNMVCQIAEGLEYVGVLCLELFLMPSGELLANEIAPRPHNSGHWTIDACYTDQFEQLIRAIAGLPLGDPSRFTDVCMKNIIGSDAEDITPYLNAPNAKLHLYGKQDIRPGRKMGHVTYLGSNDPAGMAEANMDSLAPMNRRSNG